MESEPMKCKALLSTLIIVVSTAALDAQADWTQAAAWTPDKAAGRLLGTKVRPNWVTETGGFWYRYFGHDGFRYWIVTSDGASREPLFDQGVLAAELNRLTKGSYSANSLDLEDLEVRGGAIRFSLGGRRFRFGPFAGRLEEAEPSKVVEPDPGMSTASDGTISACLRGNDLYVKKQGEDDVRLSSDGSKGLSWGTECDLVDNDDKETRRAPVLWSGDSRRFCIHRADLRAVEELWLVDHLSEPRPVLKTIKYPMPEGEVPRWELWVYDRDTERMIPIETDRFEDQTLADLFVETAWWSGNSKTLYFTRRSRDYMKVDLCAADPMTGKSRVLVEERLEGMVYIQPPVLLEKSEQFLWCSMRDGWAHYYLYDLDGHLVNQVTRGSWSVRKPLRVDEDSGVFYFMASGREEGRNPYYSHLYKVSLDGKGLKLLTPENAEHQCSLSPTGDFFVDTWSRVDLPNRNVVRDTDGELLLELEIADVSRLVAAGWKPPVIFSAKSADGMTDQWGVMYRPHDFSPDRQYPVIAWVYPGRQSEFIPLEFYPVTVASTLAQLGFIVVRHGNRGGCPERGLAYREYGRDEFRDYGLPDKKAVLEELGRRHPWIDIERVGIVGGSSGGFMTVSAMLVHPEFFRVGVAMSAPNDPSIYFNAWAERYYGIRKVKGDDGRERWNSRPDGNIELARCLDGELLMIAGAQDDNVHPAHLFRMADAFIRAGKRFDMFLVPGADHTLGDWRYVYGMALDYFAEHLLGDRPRGVNAFLFR
jgi:dipeptidyl-peptidase 4